MGISAHHNLSKCNGTRPLLVIAICISFSQSCICVSIGSVKSSVKTQPVFLSKAKYYSVDHSYGLFHFDIQLVECSMYSIAEQQKLAPFLLMAYSICASFVSSTVTITTSFTTLDPEPAKFSSLISSKNLKYLGPCQLCQILKIQL